MTWPSFITEQKRSDVRTLHFKGLTTYFTGSSWRALHLSSIFCRQSTLNLNTDLPSIWCIRYQLPSTVGSHIQLSVCVCVWNSYKVGVNECPKTKWTCKTTVTWYWNLVAPKSRFLSQEISLCFVLFYCWDVASCNQEIVIQWILLPRIAGSDLLGQYPVPV